MNFNEVREKRQLLPTVVISVDYIFTRSLDVYQRMTDDDIGDYEVLRNRLSKTFRLTEEGYRKRFKRVNCKDRSR